MVILGQRYVVAARSWLSLRFIQSIGDDADTPSRMTENERSDVREMFSGFFRTIDIWEEACFCF